MTLLILTSGDTARVGLADGVSIIAEDAWPSDVHLSLELSRRIAAVLERAGKTVSHLQQVRVHAGPGGLARLRIGVVTANALGYALGIPVHGVVGDVRSLEDLLGERPPTGAGSSPVIPQYHSPPNISERVL